MTSQPLAHIKQHLKSSFCLYLWTQTFSTVRWDISFSFFKVLYRNSCFITQKKIIKNMFRKLLKQAGFCIRRRRNSGVFSCRPQHTYTFCHSVCVWRYANVRQPAVILAVSMSTTHRELWSSLPAALSDVPLSKTTRRNLTCLIHRGLHTHHQRGNKVWPV